MKGLGGGPYAVVETTIASGATTSAAVDLFKFRPVAIQFPAALTNTSMTFTGATVNADDTFVAVYEPGGAAAYTITVGTSRIVPVDATYLWGCRYLKLVGATTEAAARTIKVICLSLTE